MPNASPLTERLRRYMKHGLMYAVLLAVPLGFFELASGYYLLQINGAYEPAAMRLARLLRNKAADVPSTPVPRTQSSTGPDNANNPFMTNVPNDDIQVRFTPFLDYANAAIAANKKGLNDFFGFRNRTNLYFSPRDKNAALIVMTGGSECLGFTHPDETIIEALQKKLQARTKRKIQALNLCMNSYTLTHEIQAYVHLAYDLKPDLIITHSGWNDVMYGMLIPLEFVQAGLIYNKWQEAWLEKLYGSVKVPTPADVFQQLHTENESEQTAAYWRSIHKYQSLVSSNGGRFLVGLQGYNPVIAEDNMARAHRQAHRIAANLYAQVPNDVQTIYFLGKQGIHYADSVHTTQDSVDTIAGIYADYIERHYPELLAKEQP